MKSCKDFVRYEGSVVKSCFMQNIQVFQDGFIRCGLVDTMGCMECMKRWEKVQEAKND